MRTYTKMVAAAFALVACGEGQLELGANEGNVESADEPLMVAFPGQTGPERTGIFDVFGEPTELTYQEIEGFKVFGGDMILGRVDGSIDIDEDGIGTGSSALSANRTWLWPGGKIPYAVDSSIRDRSMINAGVFVFNALTPVRFVPRTNEADYVLFTARSAGCFAHVGHHGGKQLINLGPGCMNSLSTVEHEMGHALGAIHEHQRPDRDTHVSVRLANVKPEYRSNFNIIPSGSDFYRTIYQVSSVMHYPSNAFAIDKSRLTIVTKAGGNIPYPAGVTNKDLAGVGALYGTPLATPSAPTGCGVMRAGQGLAPDKALVSCDGRFRVVMQGDGNLVLYTRSGRALWSSGTAGRYGWATVMQSDGNLVMYSRHSQPIWHTKTSGHAGAFLGMQDDGNLVLYAGGKALWSSGTSGY